MSVIKSLILAFSMYSRIPVPHVRLEEKDMKYTFGFFPLVGVVIGALFFRLAYFCKKVLHWNDYIDVCFWCFFAAYNWWNSY